MKDYFFGYTDKQVEELTPDLAAACVISRLKWLVDDVQENGEGHFREFFGSLIRRHNLNYQNVQEAIDSVQMFVDQPLETYAEMKNSFFILASMVYADSAITEYKDGKTQHAWVLAMQAERFLGMSMGSNPHSQIISFVKKQTAAINGVKSQERNRKTKEAVFNYYKDITTTFESYTDAANKITEIKDKDGKKKYIVSFRKLAKEWLPEFHKKNPDIPKPTKKNKFKNKSDL